MLVPPLPSLVHLAGSPTGIESVPEGSLPMPQRPQDVLGGNGVTPVALGHRFKQLSFCGRVEEEALVAFPGELGHGGAIR